MFVFLNVTVFAVEYETFGYYNGSNGVIYIQNKLSNSSIYSNHLATAVAYWNNAGVTGRSITVNTTSSCWVYNFDFSKSSDSFYVWAHANGWVSCYSFWGQTTAYCTCHKTIGFDIECNDAYFKDMNSIEKRSWLTHELGHAYGLKDYPDTRKNTTIMSYLTERTIYETPFSFDVTNANACWVPHK
jgi:predicted Zn-dependent protease